MHHNSIFEVMLAQPPSPRASSSSSHPSKRFKEYSGMTTSTMERPALLRPPSTSRAAQMLPPSDPAPRRRPYSPRKTSSTENPLNLRLPDISVGRYHPINFSSQQSSIAGTPSSGLNSPQLPLSPRMHQRQLSEAEQRLHDYYRDRAVAGTQGPLSPSDGTPISPRLVPAGSPGPVTPLELEAAAGSYFGIKAGGLSPGKMGEKGLAVSGVRRGMSPRTPSIGTY